MTYIQHSAKKIAFPDFGRTRTLVSTLRAAMRMLATDVQQHIQFNHYLNLSDAAYRAPLYHDLLGAAIVGLPSELIGTREGLSLILVNRVEEFIKRAEVFISTDAYKYIVSPTIRFGNRTFRLPTPTAAKQSGKAQARVSYMQNLISAANVLLADVRRIAEPTVPYHVPKNSDRATLDSRRFVTKSRIQETLLTTLLMLSKKSYTPHSRIYSVEGETISISVYGTSIDETNSFTSYIREYDAFKAHVARLRNVYHNGFFTFTDLAKYFDSIRHEHIADILDHDMEKQAIKRGDAGRKRRYIELIHGLLDTGNGRVGLTIETHAQHALAGRFMKSVVEEALSGGIPLNGKVDVVAFVDDIFIFATDSVDVSIAKAALQNAFAVRGIAVSEKKTIEIYPTHAASAETTFKELIRLPAGNYFNIMDDEAVISELDEDTASNSKVAIDAIRKTSALLEKNLSHLDSIDEYCRRLAITLKATPHTISKHALTPHGVMTLLDEVWESFNVGDGFDDSTTFRYAQKASPSTFHALVAFGVIAELQAMGAISFRRMYNWGVPLPHHAPLRYDVIGDTFLPWLERKDKVIMRLHDMFYYFKNFSSLSFTPKALQAHYRAAIGEDGESAILPALQYFFLARNDTHVCNERRIVEFARGIHKVYPNKARFLAAAVKVRAARLDRIHMKINDGEGDPYFHRFSIIRALLTKIYTDSPSGNVLWQVEHAKSIGDLRQAFRQIEQQRAAYVQTPTEVANFYFAYRLLNLHRGEF